MLMAFFVIPYLKCYLWKKNTQLRQAHSNPVGRFFEITRIFLRALSECFPANIYFFKVNNRNIKKRCETSSKFAIKTLERRHRRHSGVFIAHLFHIFHAFFSVFIVDFEHLNVTGLGFSRLQTQELLVCNTYKNNAGCCTIGFKYIFVAVS